MIQTAWVFPGQGSQAVGMGADLSQIPAAQAKLEKAKQILGWSILDVCQSGEEKLSHTIYTQPCLYAIEAILVDLLKDQGDRPQFVAGHSLGEYVALYTAGVFDFETGLRLVKCRAELMEMAEGGKMVAIMGFKREQLEAEIAKNPDVVIANDNSATQVVISGTPAGVDALLSQVKTRRAVALKVSGAFHSPLMAEAAQQFQTVLENAVFADAAVPVLSNVDPVPSTDAAELKRRLVEQMTGSVRWREIMDRFPELAVEKVVEVGPGQVLSGLLKRAHSSLVRENVGSVSDLKQLAGEGEKELVEV